MTLKTLVDLLGPITARPVTAKQEVDQTADIVVLLPDGTMRDVKEARTEMVQVCPDNQTPWKPSRWRLVLVAGSVDVPLVLKRD
jgi:hypothetical protein